MSEHGLGEALTAPYVVPGGTARLFAGGLTINGAEAEVIVAFGFPMIGRPSIGSGDAAAAPPFESDAISFGLGHWDEDDLVPMIQAGLDGRLALVATGDPGIRVPLQVGPARIVEPAKETGVGGVEIPAVYGFEVTLAGTPQERQLYDVAALGDGGVWHLIAPHAFYFRQIWSDFGIAHITDMHVARRIDTFRELLVGAGRPEAAARMYNWNDRFRGFVRYANYLHDAGLLDVILATGDLFDYILESDDDAATGGNAAFLRRLILGRQPGPDFADVEELLVPIFMVPGNHDYRINPYKLIFDAQIRVTFGPFGIGKDAARIRNYSGYHLAHEDARALSNALAGRSGTDIENLNAQGAAEMVRVDAENLPYTTCLGDRGSYVVKLGAHRIVMIDSSWDVGMVTDELDALRVLLGMQNEDEATFVGGSPNCEGVSADELQLATEALSDTADDALMIVGLHAPLFNVWNTEYPYFLRETQRPAQAGQVHGFLARHDGKPLYQHQPLPEQVKSHHPLWYSPEADPSPSFVKRVDSQDLLDYGVSRGKAEELMQLLAGVGARRRADVVLAGHTHRHNEFTVRPWREGELAYFMDFYTENPARAYPVRFTRSWGPGVSAGMGTVVPVTDVTYVEVVAGAAPDQAPWPMPYESAYGYQIQVPPYPNPLSSAPDARAWWDEHRPLVLQTGALGPLDSAQASFNGFRVLQVKTNVIDKIHFVSIPRLEASEYRLAWEDAIRPDSPRRYQYRERSRPLGAPPAAGPPCGVVFPALGVTNVVYRDGEGLLHELWERAAETGTSNLTELADGAKARSDPSAFIHVAEGLEVALYRGIDGHLHSFYWSTGAVGRDSLTHPIGAPTAVGNPVGYVGPDGTTHVLYRSDNGHINELWWTATNAPGHGDATALADAPAAIGDPAAYINTRTGENIAVYRAADHHVHVLYWSTGEVGHDNLSGYAQAPAAAGDPVAYYTSHNDTHQVAYRSGDGHVHELWWSGGDPVSHWDLSAAAPQAPAADSDPAVYSSAGTNTKHVIYRSADGHLNELWWTPGGGIPAHVDLTLEALAPPAAGRPTAFTVDGPNSQHVVYRGTDGHVHEIRWT